MTAWECEMTSLKLRFRKIEVTKYSDSSIMGFLHKHLFAWAAGQTFGYHIYIRDEYYGTDRGAEILKHEGAHVADWQSFGLLMTLSYLLLLPTVITMRAFWEWRGYREDLKAVHKEYAPYKQSNPQLYEYIIDYYSQWIAGVFAGPSYLWMFPFKKYMYKKCRSFVAGLE